MTDIPTWLWPIAGSASAIGLVILIWSLRGDLSRGRRRCPKCWYHMQGVPGLRCPECGREAKRERDLLRPRRRWRFATLAMLILLLAPSFITYLQFRDRGWYWLLPKYKTITDTTLADWRVRLQEVRDPDIISGQRLVISRAGSETFMLEGWRLEIGASSDLNRSTSAAHVGLGEDLTGDGVPNLIVSDYSGGAHCCTTYYILALGADAVTKLQEIETLNSGARFQDADGDGMPEMFTADNTFAYWNTSYAESPMPLVILKWREGRFDTASELMRTSAPDEASVAADARIIRQSDDWGARGFLPPVELWRRMIDLIYTGHADLAWQFLRDAWPPDKPGQMEFMVDFIAQLGRSPYWEGVRAMNVPQGMPDAGMAMP